MADVIKGLVTITGKEQIRHNAHLTTYPDGTGVLLVADRAIFMEQGWELASDKVKHTLDASDIPEDPENTVFWEKSVWDLERTDAVRLQRKMENAKRAQRRARRALRDLAKSNRFRWFVTLTLDRKKVDRYDIKEITRKLNAWLDNMVRRKGLKYVLVPERHKDGAIHFHGLFSDNIEVVDSGHKDEGGHTIYNMPQWSLGFTTAIELYGELDKAVGYVLKYIGKQMVPTRMGDSAEPVMVPSKIGGRWYYSGGDLLRPRVEALDVDYTLYAGLSDAYRFTLEHIGVTVLSIKIDGGLTYA